MVTKCQLHLELHILFVKVHFDLHQQDINNVMYAYIDRKKKLPVTTLLRAIGYESDRDILEIFNLAWRSNFTK